MRIHHVVLAAGLMLAAASSAILAKESSWTLRVHGAIVESTGHQTSIGFGGVASSVNAGGGFGIGAEYRLSDRFGLEFSTLFAGLEIGSGVSRRAATVQSLELSMMPLTLAVPFHFDVGRRVDLSVAPTFSIVRYLDIETASGFGSVSNSVDIEADAALGAALGLDVPFGKGRWALSTGLRYMNARAGDTDVEPVIITLGFAYRF